MLNIVGRILFFVIKLQTINVLGLSHRLRPVGDHGFSGRTGSYEQNRET